MADAQAVEEPVQSRSGLVPQRLVDASDAVVEWAGKNPVSATVLGVGVGGSLAVVAAPAIVMAPGLTALGFGSQGVIGGSIAAGVQSGIGSVMAPSVFSTLTSAAMGGYGVGAVTTAIQGVAVATASGTGLGVWAAKRGKASTQENNEEEIGDAEHELVDEVVEASPAVKAKI